MASEKIRGCGYRRVGAMYLVSGTNFDFCHRTPIKVPRVKFFRGYKEVNPLHLIGSTCDTVQKNKHCNLCPICNPPDEDKLHGLMFVGESYYTSESFMHEAVTLGVSKRISKIPENLVLGDSIVYLAFKYMNFPVKNNEGKIFAWEFMPGIFMAFVPQRIEQLVTESQSNDKELMENLKKQEVSPVVVPDNDKDHN